MLIFSSWESRLPAKGEVFDRTMKHLTTYGTVIYGRSSLITSGCIKHEMELNELGDRIIQEKYQELAKITLRKLPWYMNEIYTDLLNLQAITISDGLVKTERLIHIPRVSDQRGDVVIMSRLLRPGKVLPTIESRIKAPPALQEQTRIGTQR
jgi:hypothetical protein